MEIELTDENKSFLEPDPTVSVNESVVQMNRESTLGTYMIRPHSKYLLSLRYCVPLPVLRGYLWGTISELYWEVSEQFMKYIVKLKMIKGVSEMKSSKIYITLKKLQYMK